MSVVPSSTVPAICKIPVPSTFKGTPVLLSGKCPTITVLSINVLIAVKALVVDCGSDFVISFPSVSTLIGVPSLLELTPTTTVFV